MGMAATVLCVSVYRLTRGLLTIIPKKSWTILNSGHLLKKSTCLEMFEMERISGASFLQQKQCIIEFLMTVNSFPMIRQSFIVVNWLLYLPVLRSINHFFFWWKKKTWRTIRDHGWHTLDTYICSFFFICQPSQVEILYRWVPYNPKMDKNPNSWIIWLIGACKNLVSLLCFLPVGSKIIWSEFLFNPNEKNLNFLQFEGTN